MKIFLQLILWVVILFLGYLVYNSVNGPVKFNETKKDRYAQAIEKLKDIRDAELAHKTVTGKFQKDPAKLINFIETAKFTLTQRRDSSFVRFNKILNIDEPKDTIVVDTIGYASVKDSLFKKSDRYKNMMVLDIEDKKINIKLDAGIADKNGLKVPVFEAKITKDDLLHDQDQDLLTQEKDVKSVDGVNGSYIAVGSMTEINTSGNWPKTYGAND